MKQYLSHPSLPLVVALVVLLVTGLLLVASFWFPNLFKAQAAGERVQTVVTDAISAVLPNEPHSTSTTAVTGSYVLDVRDRLLKEGKTFIEADLTAMQLKVYKDGQLNVEVPIKGKGKEGSWWETPVGVYSVKNKEENHFSSFGKVYQPWSLVFQGNFFIHGWPYYPDGTPVSTSFSGGCIRLGDDTAKMVYDAVEIGTPVLVYKEQKRAAPLPAYETNPDVDGSYAIVDVPTGTAIRSRDAGGEVPLGAAVHLLTALTAVDYMNVESNVTVDEAASPRLSGFSRVSVLDLLRLLLAEGDGAAAHAISSARSEATFLRNMNAKAAAIGMAHTKINSVNPADTSNISTMGDIALLTRYLAENRSFVLQLTRSSRGNLAYDPPVWSDLQFSSELLALPGFFGGVAAQNGAPAVAVLTLNIAGEKRDVVVAASSFEHIEAAATWLTK